MEPNQANISPEIPGIPEGIPTWVFVPNNQSSVVVDIPVQNTASSTPIQTSVATPVIEQSVSPVQSPIIWTQPTVSQISEGPLDKIFKWLARFFAKVMGQPDPITWAPNPASQALQKSENIVGKVRGAANQVVTKASDVAAKAADTVNQATQSVQQLIPPPAAVPQVPPQPIEQVAPVQPQVVTPIVPPPVV